MRKGCADNLKSLAKKTGDTSASFALTAASFASASFEVSDSSPDKATNVRPRAEHTRKTTSPKTQTNSGTVENHTDKPVRSLSHPRPIPPSTV